METNLENHKETAVAATKQPLLAIDDQKGGFTTLPFIIANEASEKMVTYGLTSSMTLYLVNQYRMEMTIASNLMFAWSATTNFMPLPGAIIADSFLGRFYTIGVGSVVCLMGMVLLWSTTILPHAKPPPCDHTSTTCSATTSFQYMFLCSSLGLISIGAGGIRACSLAFGADQLETREFQASPSAKERYFGWYYGSYILAVLISLTCVVYIQENVGWGIGFAVPAIFMLFAAVSFFMASQYYVKLKSKTSLVTGFIQVFIASFRNRHLELSNCTDIVYHCKTGSPLVTPTRKLRFLNKASIIRDIQNDLNIDGEATNPWRLSTVDQVEELKALLRVVPIWSSGMFMCINICQTSFPVLQAASMNRHITSSFTIPAASFATFSVIAAIVWVVLYDRIFLPVASKVIGRRVHISPRTRMGFGIFISLLSTVVTALVESIRRDHATREGSSEYPHPAMSAMWLVPQYCLLGISEAANAVAQNEFYYSELPRSMSSIASTLMGIGLFPANLIASFIMNMIDSITKSGGKESWISTDINKGHYDYYYLILAGVSTANMLYFLVCSKAYGPSKEELDKTEDGNEF